MFERIQNYLMGKKTYIVVVVGFIVNGLYGIGYIDVQTVQQLNALLVFLGIGAVRLSLDSK